MSVFGKPLDQATEADLQDLVQNQVRERQTLEFKRDPYPSNDKGKREMLRDISAMANAYGGEVLMGLAETGDGIASGVAGISDGERMAQSIESSCLSNIDERIGGLKTQAVLLANRKHVVIIQIPQSLRMPHMVTFQGLNQFWIRHDRQKSRMSTDEIREACLRIEMLT
jgi:predicted HTH transcriptional regulator